MNRLDQIEARANAATEGPWLVNGPDEQWAVISSGSDSVLHSYMRCRPDCEGCECGESVAEVAIELEDAEFIAHARTDIPALTAAVRDVLALHWEATCSRGYPQAYCVDCDQAWPCPTVRALAAHLDLTDPEGDPT